MDKDYILPVAIPGSGDALGHRRLQRDVDWERIKPLLIFLEGLVALDESSYMGGWKCCKMCGAGALRLEVLLHHRTCLVPEIEKLLKDLEA